MRPSGKTWIACVVVFVHVMLSPALLAQAVNGSPAQADEQILARRVKYQELLQSVKPREGQAKEHSETIPSLLHRTRDNNRGTHPIFSSSLMRCPWASACVADPGAGDEGVGPAWFPIWRRNCRCRAVGRDLSRVEGT